MIDKETLKLELSNTNNYSWIYDADIDLIEEKKNALQQFGLKIPIGLGSSVCCPYLWNQKNQFARFVPLSFCTKCHNCFFDDKRNFIYCGQVLPFPLSEQERRKLFAAVFVNERKVLFASEFKKYRKSFNVCLEKAMQQQYYAFMNVARNMYGQIYQPNPHYSSYQKQRQYYHRYYRNKKKF